MCLRCEGYSWEEIDRHHDLAIRVHGYLIRQVVDGASPWSYTVGLDESWGHPDLVCVDIAPDVQVALIGALVAEIAESGEIGARVLDDLDLELLVVDEEHFSDGMVAGWEGRHARRAVAGDFLQIVPGSSWFGGVQCPRVRRLGGGGA